MSSSSTWRTALRGALSLFLLGMVGVVAVAVYTVPTLRTIPELESLSYPLLLLVAAVNSIGLLAVFVILGTVTAPKVGLQSHVFNWATHRDPDWNAFRASLPTAVGFGVGLFFVAALLEAVFAQFVTIETGAVVSDVESLRILVESVPMRLFYGGITEELLIRWGLMTPLAWGIWRVRNGNDAGSATPARTTIWAAIVLSAVLFGVGHLPAVAASYSLTIPLIAQIVSLNTVVGLGFGWLYWRYSLETAMVAHMMFHVTLVTISAALILLA